MSAYAEDCPMPMTDFRPSFFYNIRVVNDSYCEYHTVVLVPRVFMLSATCYCSMVIDGGRSTVILTQRQWSCGCRGRSKCRCWISNKFEQRRRWWCIKFSALGFVLIMVITMRIQCLRVFLIHHPWDESSGMYQQGVEQHSMRQKRPACWRAINHAISSQQHCSSRRYPPPPSTQFWVIPPISFRWATWRILFFQKEVIFFISWQWFCYGSNTSECKMGNIQIGLIYDVMMQMEKHPQASPTYSQTPSFMKHPFREVSYLIRAFNGRTQSSFVSNASSIKVVLREFRQTNTHALVGFWTL